MFPIRLAKSGWKKCLIFSRGLCSLFTVWGSRTLLTYSSGVPVMSPEIPRLLTALPVYNEESHVASVLTEVLQHVSDVLVVNDGSTDRTASALASLFPQVVVRTHPENRGYGAALQTAFEYALTNGYEVLVTMDCDGQHQPSFLNEIAALVDDATAPVDMVSGSRYLAEFDDNTRPPEERRRINSRITACLREKQGLKVSEPVCGIKAERVCPIAARGISEKG
ncbi:MAG: glycosyltransferase family 2 protein, partial [Planctomyces sp.]